MKHYWVTFANTDYDASRLDVARLSYPLSMHVPQLAFSEDNVISVSEKTEKFQVGVELAVKLRSDIFCESKESASKAIESCHLAISVTNSFHIDGIRSRIVTPSDQDEADSEYFTRWWEANNSISEKLDSDFEDLAGREIEFEGKGFHQSANIEYFHSPAEIVHFVSNINRLYKGTYICLGHIFRHELEVAQADEMEIKALIAPVAEYKARLRRIK